MSEQPEVSPTTGRVDDGRADLPSGALKQVDAGLLNVGYAEAGPADGRAVVLLHGWLRHPQLHRGHAGAGLGGVPGDRPLFAGLRHNPLPLRNGQQSVLGVDVIALMDALGIHEAIIAGFDWGARAANVAAALWPGRCKAMVSVSGYLMAGGLPSATADADTAQRALVPAAQNRKG